MSSGCQAPSAIRGEIHRWGDGRSQGWGLRFPPCESGRRAGRPWLAWAVAGRSAKHDNLPESRRRASEDDAHVLQNPRRSGGRGRRNATIRCESAALHSETALHNVKNSPQQRRCSSKLHGMRLVRAKATRVELRKFRQLPRKNHVYPFGNSGKSLRHAHGVSRRRLWSAAVLRRFRAHGSFANHRRRSSECGTQSGAAAHALQSLRRLRKPLGPFRLCELRK
jgi:hypothetical protein